MIRTIIKRQFQESFSQNDKELKIHFSVTLILSSSQYALQLNEHYMTELDKSQSHAFLKLINLQILIRQNGTKLAIIRGMFLYVISCLNIQLVSVVFLPNCKILWKACKLGHKTSRIILSIHKVLCCHSGVRQTA